MTRRTVLSTAVVALATLTPVWLAGTNALGQDQPRPTRVTPTPATRPAAGWAPVNAHTEAHGRAHVYWTSAGAQEKALQYIQSGQAHQNAVASLQQCQTCHSGVASYVRFANQHADGINVVADGPWVGVSVGPADDVLRSQLKLPEGTGVVVTKIVPESPAIQAGVAEHDILLSVDGQPIATGEALDGVVRAWKTGAPPLTLKLLRDGQPREIQVTPALAAPQQFIEFYGETLLDGRQEPPYRIGVSVSAPDETLRRQLRLGESGIVVTAVADDGPAHRQGVKVNDVLVLAGRAPLKNPEDLTAAVRQAAEAPLELELVRGGVNLRVTVTPEKSAGPQADAGYGVALDLSAAVAAQPRELMIVQPGLVQSYLTSGTHAAAPAPSRSAPTTADPLDQIVAQLDQLRATVESMRADPRTEGTPQQEGRR